jgi:hypothetical protein
MIILFLSPLWNPISYWLDSALLISWLVTSSNLVFPTVFLKVFISLVYNNSFVLEVSARDSTEYVRIDPTTDLQILTLVSGLRYLFCHIVSLKHPDISIAIRSFARNATVTTAEIIYTRIIWEEYWLLRISGCETRQEEASMVNPKVQFWRDKNIPDRCPGRDSNPLQTCAVVSDISVLDFTDQRLSTSVISKSYRLYYSYIRIKVKYVSTNFRHT